MEIIVHCENSSSSIQINGREANDLMIIELQNDLQKLFKTIPLENKQDFFIEIIKYITLKYGKLIYSSVSSSSNHYCCEYIIKTE